MLKITSSRIRVPDISPEGLEVLFSLDHVDLTERANAYADTYSDIGVKPPRFVFRDPAEVRATLIRENTTVHISGKVSVSIESQCARCAELATKESTIDFSIVAKPEAELDEGNNDDIGLTAYQNDEIEVKAIVEEIVMVEIPYTLLCSEGCLGRCFSCGTDLNKSPCSCSESIQEEEPSGPFLKLKDRIIRN